MADGDKSLQLRSTQIKKKRKFERKSKVVVTTATAKVLRRRPFYALGKLQPQSSPEKKRIRKSISTMGAADSKYISLFE
jgi:hypothetical protein